MSLSPLILVGCRGRVCSTRVHTLRFGRIQCQNASSVAVASLPSHANLRPIRDGVGTLPYGQMCAPSGRSARFERAENRDEWYGIASVLVLVHVHVHVHVLDDDAPVMQSALGARVKRPYDAKAEQEGVRSAPFFARSLLVALTSIHSNPPRG